MMDKTVNDAFLAMKAAYDKFVRESEELIKANRERTMNLPPTLGQTNKQ